MNLKTIKFGVYAGLAGGVVFGVMMAMMGMLPMVGQMVGQPTAIVGFVVHLVISAIIGASFAVILGPFTNSRGSGLRNGLIYGAIWWVLGPLTLMPLGLGMGVTWNLAAASAMLPSLVGHLVYGAILGFGYAWLSRSREESLSQA